MTEKPPTGESELVIKPRSRGLRRITTTVERLEAPTRPTWTDTSEMRLPADEREHHSGLFRHPDAVAHEVAPLIAPRRSRPLAASERWLRVATGASLTLFVVVLFWPALHDTARRISGAAPVAAWREIPLKVTSNPSGAKVFVGEALVGRTPLSAAPSCRGRKISVRVERRGYEIWQWSGFCVGNGLSLQANLNPR